MRISVTGWARDCGPTVLLDARVGADRKIRITRFDHKNANMVFRELYAIRIDDKFPRGFAGVILTAQTEHPIRLNGEYRIEIRINADELLRLAIAATKNWPVSFLLDQIEAARKAATNG
jgi:hypothetical protein